MRALFDVPERPFSGPVGADLDERRWPLWTLRGRARVRNRCLPKRPKIGAAGTTRGRPRDGREGLAIESSTHTHHSGRVRAAGTGAAGEPHAGSKRGARPEGEFASESNGPRLP